MNAYINGTGNISPQKTSDPEIFLDEIRNQSGISLNCIEPDYEKLIDSRQLRRMSRIIRMSWSAAKICLDDAKVQLPDAIITGTGMGCLEDTEKFLSAIYESDERLLPPTPFIQSTHNTIGSQIALMLQCTRYNMTHTQRGISFENALLDGISLLDEPEYPNVLVGGFDEMTSNQLILYNRLKYYKNDVSNNLDLLKCDTPGTMAGEGSAFFLITKEKGTKSYAAIRDVATFHSPQNSESIKDNIASFLTQNRLATNEIDLIITGMNGDFLFDEIYHEVTDQLFGDIPAAYFKHLCGEYHTASAFAVWLATKILQRQSLPEILLINKTSPKSFNNILIYNQYRNIDHSLILLSSC